MAENDIIYLEIPLLYKCVYNKLIVDVASLGIKGLTIGCKNSSMPCNTVSDIIGDCNEISNVLDSWNMFQIACTASELEELEKADKIINYINRKMNYCCDMIDREYGNSIYFGISDTIPTLNSIIQGSKFSFSPTKRNFNFSIPTRGHYIAVPENHNIISIENISFRGDWLYNSAFNIDLYTKTNITIAEKSYVLWYCEFIIPFNATVEIKL